MSRDAAAVPRGLNYASDLDPGIRRKATRRGFAYLGPDGNPIEDPATLDRIRGLVIPPAWTDVWISPDAHGHIQVTARDAKGRKQYRYHPDWSANRDEAKFERVAAFGRALPRLRRRIDRDLRRRGLPREKVLAAVVALLEATLVRVGNDAYARANKSYGLTTLQKRHVKATTTGATFEFRGKSGKTHRTGFQDRRLARVVRACQDLRGQRLFKYVNGDGVPREVTSGDVNDYMREVLGEDFTAKDFRTWFGTVGAARALALQPPPQSEREAKRRTAEAIKAVAGLLGNTPAVCRAAYVHPRIIELYENNQLRLTPCDGRAFETAVIRRLEAPTARS